MAGQYFPINVRSFTPKVNLQDIVNADDVNSLYTEVYNIEYYLNGTTADGMLTSTWTSTFTQPSTPWNSLADRLANIEGGLINGLSNSPYFKKSGDSLTVTSTVGLTAKAASSSSADLIQTYSSSNTLGFKVDNTGTPKVGTNNVLYVNSADYNAIITSINGATTLASATPFDSFLLAGM